MVAKSSKHAAEKILSGILKNTGIVSTPKKKTAKQLERHFKGLANHRRIEILQLVSKRSGITLDEIAQILNCNFKTVSDHSLRLTRAGLLEKKHAGTYVTHSLSPYGKIFMRFIEVF